MQLMESTAGLVTGDDQKSTTCPSTGRAIREARELSVKGDVMISRIVAAAPLLFPASGGSFEGERNAKRHGREPTPEAVGAGSRSWKVCVVDRSNVSCHLFASRSHLASHKRAWFVS